MQTNFKGDSTLVAWRDCAIGLVLFLVALRVFQTRPFAPATFIASQALFVGVTILAHVALYRSGKFTEVTGTLVSFGRIGVLRFGVVGVAALVLMFSVWSMAQMMGGAIERPLPWAPQLLDRSVGPPGYFFAISFYVVVTAPIIEELCFRGWIQRGLGRRFNPAITIFTPAFLFAALHASVYSHPAYLLIPLALGLTFGLLSERSGSLWPSIILHVLWNISILVISVRDVESPLSWQARPNALDMFVVLAAIALSSSLVLRLLPRLDQAQRAGPSPVLDTPEAA